ncbi:MAG: hypothetical protein DRJ56_02505 [Thermoprotei archaeon]|nr:MAG: hypothetical protein DRJ56_02505 [Thermoprotei archaeon]
MPSKAYSYMGVLGVAVPWAFIGVAVARSPWFSWGRSALSDLGHSLRSEAAPLYNLGLALGADLLLLYAANSLLPRARLSGLCVAATAVLLQLVAVFDEVYGCLHTLVSLLFFVALLAASLAHATERRSALALASFVAGALAWALYWAGAYSAGMAVPETISALSASAWVVRDSLADARQG